MKISKLILFTFMFLSFLSFSAQAQRNSGLIINSLTTNSDFVSKSQNLNIDSIASMHNEGLDFVLDALSSQNNSPTDASINSSTTNLWQQFFFTKGINVSISFTGTLEEWAAQQPSTICQPKSVSVECQNLICTIQDKIELIKQNSLSISQFSTEMDAVIQNSISIPNSDEKDYVHLVAAITKNSFQYWEANFSSRYDQLSNLLPTDKKEAAIAGKPTIRWWAVGLADAWGAFNWGSGGLAVGGPGGAVAAGLVGACYQSGTSILAQTVVHQITHH